jgi:hypothetical protein
LTNLKPIYVLHRLRYAYVQNQLSDVILTRSILHHVNHKNTNTYQPDTTINISHVPSKKVSKAPRGFKARITQWDTRRKWVAEYEKAKLEEKEADQEGDREQYIGAATAQETRQVTPLNSPPDINVVKLVDIYEEVEYFDKI